MRNHLIVGELGLALLSEGCHALLLVVGAKSGVEQSALKGQSGGKRDLERLVDGILDHLHDGLGQVTNLLGRLDSLIHHLVGGKHPADKSSAFGLLCGQVDRSSQAHFHCLGLANGFDKALRTTSSRDSSQLDFGLTEDSLVTGIDDVYRRKRTPVSDNFLSFQQWQIGLSFQRTTHHGKFTSSSKLGKKEREIT